MAVTRGIHTTFRILPNLTNWLNSSTWWNLCSFCWNVCLLDLLSQQGSEFSLRSSEWNFLMWNLTTRSPAGCQCHTWIWIFGHIQWTIGGRPLAAATRLPHSSSSLLQSSLCVVTSMKQRLSGFAFAPSRAVISSASVFAWVQEHSVTGFNFFYFSNKLKTPRSTWIKRGEKDPPSLSIGCPLHCAEPWRKPRNPSSTIRGIGQHKRMTTSWGS